MFDWSHVEGHYPSVEKKTKQNKKEQQVDKQLWALSFVPRGVPWISSDRDDRRIFWVGQFGRYFWGIQNNLKICGSARAYPGQ